MKPILVVDDEPAIADLISLTLKQAGYTCQIAYDGLTAADMLEENDYALALLDIMLPEIDGYDLLEYALTLKVPVIFVTAKGATRERVAGLRLGADDYIVKPFEPEELLARIENYMDNILNEEGFYKAEPIKDKNNGNPNLMFYNFKTRQQEFVCKVQGCIHDNKDCISYSGDWYSDHLFSYKENLFVFYTYYNDGNESSDDIFSWPSALVRYERDGTGGKVMLTRPNGVLRGIDVVFCDGDALYFLAWEGLLRVDINTFEVTCLSDEIRKIENAEGNLYTVSPYLYKGEILCLRVNRSAAPSELISFNVNTCVVSTLHEFTENEPMPYNICFGEDGTGGYYIEPETGEVHGMNLATGEDILVTDMLCEFITQIPKQNNADNSGTEQGHIVFSAERWSIRLFEEWLIIDTSFLPDTNAAVICNTFAYNTITGESTEITFMDFYNGYEHNMKVYGLTSYGLLVTEETRTVAVSRTGPRGEPFTANAEYDVYAFISLDDFVHSIPNFYTIAPVEY